MAQGLNILWFQVLVIPYFLTILYLWYSLGNKGQHLQISDSSPDPHPPDIKFTVIIAVKNEEPNLPSLISDLKNLKYPPGSYEIIFSDDNSADNTWLLIKKGSEESDNINIIHSKGNGKKAAISTAIELAKGDYIVTTDADCKINPMWLNGLAEICKKTNADLIIGEADLANRPGLFGKLGSLEYLSLQAITAASACSGHPVLCSGANLCFKKDSVSNYSDIVKREVASGDDIFLLHEIKRKNGIIVFCSRKNTRVVTDSPGNIKSFIKQRMRWAGKGLKYNDPDTMLLALLVFITNTLIVIILALSAFYPRFLYVAGLFYFWKSIADLLLLLRYAKHRNRLKLVRYFIPAELLYPFYVVISTIAGMISIPRWNQK